MLINPSTFLRFAYCIIVLGATLPFGLAASGWVALAKGPSPFGLLPLIGPLLLLVVGGFRVYLVARFATTLSSPPVAGVAAVMRVLGLIAIYVGVVATVSSWIARPLMWAFMTTRDSGAEWVSLYLSLVAGVGLLGLFLFEFSRLLAFERLAYERRERQRARLRDASLMG